MYGQTQFPLQIRRRAGQGHHHRNRQHENRHRQRERHGRQRRPQPVALEVLHQDVRERHAASPAARGPAAGAGEAAPVLYRVEFVAVEHALVEVQHAVAIRRSARVVRHHDDRLAEVRIEETQQVQDFLRRLRIQITRRLIGQDRVRVGYDRPRNRDPAAPAHLKAGWAGDRRGRLRPTMSSAVFTRPPAFLAGHVEEQQRQLDVLGRGEHRYQVVHLKDEADVPTTPGGQRPLAQVLKSGLANADPSRTSASPGRRSGAASWTCRSRSDP